MSKPNMQSAILQAVATERLRIHNILTSAPGLRNQAMARKLALTTSLDADQAVSLLKDAPADNPFIEAMHREGPSGFGDLALAGNSAGDAIGLTNESPRERRLREIRANVGSSKRKVTA